MNTANSKYIIAEKEINETCDLWNIWDSFIFERDFEDLLNFCDSKCPEKSAILKKNKTFFQKNNIKCIQSLFHPAANANYFFLKETSEKILNQFTCKSLEMPASGNPFLNQICGMHCIDNEIYVCTQQKCCLIKEDKFVDAEEKTAKILLSSTVFHSDHSSDALFWTNRELLCYKEKKWECISHGDTLPPMIEAAFWDNKECCVLGRNPDGNLLFHKIGTNQYTEFDKDFNVLQAVCFGDIIILIATMIGSSDYHVLTSISGNKEIFQKKEFSSDKKIKIFQFKDIVFLIFYNNLLYKFADSGDKWISANVILDYIIKIKNYYLGLKENKIYTSKNGGDWTFAGYIPKNNYHPSFFAHSNETIVCSSFLPYEICKITLPKGI